WCRCCSPTISGCRPPRRRPTRSPCSAPSPSRGSPSRYRRARGPARQRPRLA
ncbi:MAG: Anhydro-N-acetylmuramic acid kinase, partial [uncultured Friedmanniella sp.]